MRREPDRAFGSGRAGEPYTTARRLPGAWVRALGALAVVAAALPPHAALAQEAGKTKPLKRIVFLYSDEPTIPGNILIDRGLRAGFAKDPAFRTEFFHEYLDLTRFSGEAYDQRLASVLSQKYGGRQPDLLVAISSAALLYTSRWGPIVFPGVPVIYVGAARASAFVPAPGFEAPGVPAEFDFRGTVQAALRQRPQTRRVVVVSGTTRTDRGYLELARAGLAGLERQVSFEYLTDLSMSEILDRVARLPRDTVILYLAVIRDAAGQDFQPPDALELVAARSSVPVYGPSVTYLGRGIVGGHLYDWEAAGGRAADLGLRVLHGADPRAIASTAEGLSSWLFDARQLKRWGISESALPPGSGVRFREPSLWRERPWLMVGLLGFLVFETGLIVGLVVQRYQRRRAEEQRRLLAAIVESSNDAVIGIDAERRVVSWNEGARRVFGYAADEAVGQDADLLVPADRREEAHAAFEAVLAGRTVPPFETIRVKKDGAPVEVSISDSPIHDTRGRVIGISSSQRDISETRRAQQALRESEEHLSLATAAAALAPWVWYVKEDSIWVTDSAYRLYGLDPRTQVPKRTLRVETVVEAAHPDERDAVRAGLKAAIANRTDYRMEHRVVWPNGETRWILAHGRCEYEDDGTPRRMVGVSIDITDRKRTEEALRASEEQLRSVFATMAEGVLLYGSDGRVITCNAAAERILGRPLEELRNTTPLVQRRDAVHEDGSPFPTEEHPSMVTLRTGQSCKDVVLGIRKPDGEPTWISVNSQPLLHPGTGSVAAVVVTFSDITDRKRAEQAVRESEAKFRQFFTEVPDYCYIVSTAGTILDVNTAALNALGYRSDELVGQPVLKIYAPESHPRMRELFEQWRRTGLIVNEETVIVTAGGERRAVILNVGAERDAQGNILHSTSVQTDITDRKRAEIERQQLQQELSHVARVSMMGELTSSLAHELNQPLTAILSNTQAAQRLLAEGTPDLEELREILSDIVADDDRAGGIIARLRALLRKGQPEFQPLDLNALVRDVAGLIRTDTIIKGISLALDLAPEIPRVQGDRIQLQQVILNLMLNSLEAMTTAGGERRLVVHTESGDGVVRVAIRDSGRGIPADLLTRVFEPFFTTRAEGMGMGLTIARSIVNSHRGRIWAENNPDGGATFTVALPATR